MAEIDLTPVKKKDPLVINYGEIKIGPLPSSLPAGLLDELNNVPRPKVMAGSQKELYESARGEVVLAYFTRELIDPETLKKLDVPDIGPIVEAWSDYAGLGKA